MKCMFNPLTVAVFFQKTPIAIAFKKRRSICHVYKLLSFNKLFTPSKFFSDLILIFQNRESKYLMVKKKSANILVGKNKKAAKKISHLKKFCRLNF